MNLVLQRKTALFFFLVLLQCFFGIFCASQPIFAFLFFSSAVVVISLFFLPLKYMFCLIILALPFSDISFVDANITVFHIMALILVPSWILSGILEKKETNFTWPPAAIPYAILLGYATMSIIWVPNIMTTDPFLQLLKLFFGLIIYLITVNIITSSRILTTSLWLYWIAGIIMIFVGILQVFGVPIGKVQELTSICAFSKHHVDFGMYLVHWLLMGIALSYVTKSKINRIMIYMSFLPMMLVMLSTSARTAYTVFAITFTIFLIFHIKRHHLFFISIFFAVFIVAISISWHKIESSNIILSIGSLFSLLDDSSMSGRTVIWKMASRMFSDTYGIGTGVGGIRLLWNDYAPLSALTTEEGNMGKNPHSMYFYTIAEFGIVGIILHITIFTLLLKTFIIAIRKLYPTTQGKMVFVFFLVFVAYAIEGIGTRKIDNYDMWLDFGIGMSAINIFCAGDKGNLP